jgi:hypothetical protein
MIIKLIFILSYLWCSRFLIHKACIDLKIKTNKISRNINSLNIVGLIDSLLWCIVFVMAFKVFIILLRVLFLIHDVYRLLLVQFVLHLDHVNNVVADAFYCAIINTNKNTSSWGPWFGLGRRLTYFFRTNVLPVVGLTLFCFPLSPYDWPVSCSLWKSIMRNGFQQVGSGSFCRDL